jgi:hypothetical protein
MQTMNFLRRPLRTPSSQPGFRTPHASMGLASERADLSGLEVSDSSWEEWMLVQREVQARRATVAQGAARKASLQ